MSITSFQFARRLRDGLRDGAICTAWPDEGLPHYRVTGRFDIGARFVSLEIRVWQDFDLVKRFRPEVRSHEPWMRDGKEWHNDEANGMCWVLNELWCDAMNWNGKSPVAILREGCEWLFNDVRCLINRHYIAHLEKITKWQKEWAYWEHGPNGARQYEREKQMSQKSRP